MFFSIFIAKTAHFWKNSFYISKIFSSCSLLYGRSTLPVWGKNIYKRSCKSWLRETFSIYRLSIWKWSNVVMAFWGLSLFWITKSVFWRCLSVIFNHVETLRPYLWGSFWLLWLCFFHHIGWVGLPYLSAFTCNVAKSLHSVFYTSETCLLLHLRSCSELNVYIWCK